MRPTTHRRSPIEASRPWCVAAALALLAAPAVATSPWSLLEELREALVSAGPITGRFEQTYVPAGFSSGDTESGHLSLWLPDCLRWNYEQPEAKSFLLCGDEVYAWSPLEPGGRHYRIEPEQEPGLDLLKVEVPKLQERYLASSERLPDGTWEIALAAPQDSPRRFDARLRIDPETRRLRTLEYTDEEGNRTRFEITDYQPLAHTALFQPPKDVEWSEQ